VTGRLPIAILVAGGGVAGAGVRWAVLTTLVEGGAFPWATLLVNVVGCLAVGLLAGAAQGTRALLGIGFAGGLTTFSTFTVEAALLLDDVRPGLALAYVTASVLSGAAAVVTGRRWAGRVGSW
jgi:CrcB protein